MDGFTSPLAIDEDLIPNSFRLDEPYPNPFNPSTQIPFSIKIPGKVQIKVFDLKGREIATLLNDNKPAGSHNVVITPSTLAGHSTITLSTIGESVVLVWAGSSNGGWHVLAGNGYTLA